MAVEFEAIRRLLVHGPTKSGDERTKLFLLLLTKVHVLLKRESRCSMAVVSPNAKEMLHEFSSCDVQEVSAFCQALERKDERNILREVAIELFGMAVTMPWLAAALVNPLHPVAHQFSSDSTPISSLKLLQHCVTVDCDELALFKETVSRLVAWTSQSNVSFGCDTFMSQLNGDALDAKTIKCVDLLLRVWDSALKVECSREQLFAVDGYFLSVILRKLVTYITQENDSLSREDAYVLLNKLAKFPDLVANVTGSKELSPPLVFNAKIYSYLCAHAMVNVLLQCNFDDARLPCVAKFFEHHLMAYDVNCGQAFINIVICALSSSSNTDIWRVFGRLLSFCRQTVRTRALLYAFGSCDGDDALCKLQFLCELVQVGDGEKLAVGNTGDSRNTRASEEHSSCDLDDLLGQHSLPHAVMARPLPNATVLGLTLVLASVDADLVSSAGVKCVEQKVRLFANVLRPAFDVWFRKTSASAAPGFELQKYLTKLLLFLAFVYERHIVLNAAKAANNKQAGCRERKSQFILSLVDEQLTTSNDNDGRRTNIFTKLVDGIHVRLSNSDERVGLMAQTVAELWMPLLLRRDTFHTSRSGSEHDLPQLKFECLDEKLSQYEDTMWDVRMIYNYAIGRSTNEKGQLPDIIELHDNILKKDAHFHTQLEGMKRLRDEVVKCNGNTCGAKERNIQIPTRCQVVESPRTGEIIDLSIRARSHGDSKSLLQATTDRINKAFQDSDDEEFPEPYKAAPVEAKSSEYADEDFVRHLPRPAFVNDAIDWLHDAGNISEAQKDPMRVASRVEGALLHLPALLQALDAGKRLKADDTAASATRAPPREIEDRCAEVARAAFYLDAGSLPIPHDRLDKLRKRAVVAICLAAPRQVAPLLVGFSRDHDVCLSERLDALACLREAGFRLANMDYLCSVPLYDGTTSNYDRLTEADIDLELFGLRFSEDDLKCNDGVLADSDVSNLDKAKRLVEERILANTTYKTGRYDPERARSIDKNVPGRVHRFAAYAEHFLSTGLLTPLPSDRALFQKNFDDRDVFDELKDKLRVSTVKTAGALLLCARRSTSKRTFCTAAARLVIDSIMMQTLEAMSSDYLDALLWLMSSACVVMMPEDGSDSCKLDNAGEWLEDARGAAALYLLIDKLSSEARKTSDERLKDAAKQCLGLIIKCGKLHTLLTIGGVTLND